MSRQPVAQSLPFETGKKRVEFDPVKLRLINYDTEIIFANLDVAENFLDILEAMLNTNSKISTEEVKLVEDEDFDYVTVKVEHDAELAFSSFFDEL
jgi:hypothetical protein